MSLMSVSIGVLPTRRTKNSCSMTEEDTVLREGSRSSSFPNLVGWLGYWLRQYSSKAHCDFSCSCSITCTSERPQASEIDRKGYLVRLTGLQKLEMMITIVAAHVMSARE